MGSYEGSNVEVDLVWGIYTPKLLDNWNLWFPIHQSLRYWAFFVVNDRAKKKFITHKWCGVLCVTHFMSWNTRLGGNINDLWATNRNHDINVFKKHIFHDHLDIYNKWELFLLARGLEIPESKKELTKKRKIIAFSQNTNFFGSYCPYNKLDHAQHVLKKIWYYML